MSGFTKSYRRRWEHPAFRDYVEAGVWAWMCDAASFQPRRLATKFGPVDLKRGQLLISERLIAKKFRMGRTAFRTILRRLASEQMIDLNSDHIAANAGTIVTIVNYDKYQSAIDPKDDAPNHPPENGEPPPNHLRTTSEPQEKEGNKEGKKKGEGEAPDGAPSRYRFAGETIKLSEADYTKWQGICPTLVQLGIFDSLLRSRDLWFQRPENERKREEWFYSTSRYLENENRKAAVDLAKPGNGRLRPPRAEGHNPDAIDRDDPDIAAMLADEDAIDRSDPAIAAMLARAE